MMATIGQLIDRIYRQVLEPPNAQPPRCRLNGGVTIGATTAALHGFQVPEDEDLMGTNTVIEIGSELIDVTGYTTEGVASLKRGQHGTEAAAHTTDSWVKLAPPFARIDVWNSLVENIVLLGQRLYTTKTDYVAVLDSGAAAVDAAGVTPLEFKPDEYMGTSTVSFPARIVEYHPATGGRAVVVDGYYGSGYLTYTKRMIEPTSEAQTLADVGVENVWQILLVTSVAADLLSGRDIPKSHQQWVAQNVMSDSVPVGSSQNLAVQLRQYRNALLRDFTEEMDIDHRPTVRFRDAFIEGA